MHRHERVLRGRDQVQVLALDLVDDRPEVVQVDHPLVGLPLHHQRRTDGGEPPLAEGVEGVPHYRLLEQERVPLQEEEAGARPSWRPAPCRRAPGP